MRERIIGVDFSGASDAGKKIWIAECRVAHGDGSDHSLIVEKCFAARDLPNAGIARERALPALVAFLGAAQDAIAGLDFPFGIPASLVNEASWNEFLDSFPVRFRNGDEFRRECTSKAGGRELKRHTDVETRTPFCTYNLRMFRQSHRGLSEVLHPLIASSLAVALPMQLAQAHRAWLVEICPASTLKRIGCYSSYKDVDDAPRREILRALEHSVPAMRFASPDIRDRCIAERHGDAVDSIIAALATFRAMLSGFRTESADPRYQIEGHVYT